MGRIFGISDLPVTKPFPSLEFGKMNEVKPPFLSEINITKSVSDTFVKKVNEGNIKTLLSKFFHRKHTKV